MLAENIAEVEDMMLKAQLLCQVFGLHDALYGAATFLLSHAGLTNRIERTEGDSDQFVALFEQQHRSYRAVDATAHSYEHALVHLLHSSIFSIGANALAANSSGTMTSLVSSRRHS